MPHEKKTNISSNSDNICIETYHSTLKQHWDQFDCTKIFSKRVNSAVIFCSNLWLSPSFILDFFFPFLQSWSTSGKNRTRFREAQCKGKKSIHRSFPLQVYMYVSSPFLLPQLTPVPFLFLQFSPPPVLIPLLLPASSFIHHLPLKLQQNESGEER